MDGPGRNVWIGSCVPACFHGLGRHEPDHDPTSRSHCDLGPIAKSRYGCVAPESARTNPGLPEWQTARIIARHETARTNPAAPAGRSRIARTNLDSPSRGTPPPVMIGKVGRIRSRRPGRGGDVGTGSRTAGLLAAFATRAGCRARVEIPIERRLPVGRVCPVQPKKRKQPPERTESAIRVARTASAVSSTPVLSVGSSGNSWQSGATPQRRWLTPTAAFLIISTPVIFEASRGSGEMGGVAVDEPGRACRREVIF
jgi:hypothetical protein